MSFFIYNTLTRQKETFQPLEPGRVRLYVCGPTVYDHSHIGHARAVVVFDVLVRHLRAVGHQVTYVRNFTDLDDKIINRANEEGVPYLELARTYIDSFLEDMDALGALRPDLAPRATEEIEGMIRDTAGLIERGHAYPVGGDVYFDVDSLPQYGRLSGRQLEDMRAGARVSVDERKKNPLDFALWKESKPGEPAWPSPWGLGRPGWHIECSAMSDRYLGAEFDIHGGGADLIFPHHENEIAQAAGLGRPFARYWMHNGFVRVNNEKMSKSLKNFFTVKEVLAKFAPEVIRLFLLSKHYRSPVDFSDEALDETKRSLNRAYQALRGAKENGAWPGQTPGPEARPTIDRFTEALDDDLNTAKAIGHIFEAVKEINRLIDAARHQPADADAMASWSAALRDMGHVLGVLGQDPDQWLTGQSEPETEAAAGEVVPGLTADRIEALIARRAEARQAKDFAEADRIRDELKAAGVTLEDAGPKTTWRVAE
jgi:cysteinyl-tRNA synthetase